MKGFFMKLDKNTIQMITKMPDDHLWKIICALGVSSGIDLSGVRMDKNQLEKVRQALSQMTDADIEAIGAGDQGMNCKLQEGGKE